jgi:prepilin-type N-terminal cleavage/methylation domain-containing protein
MSNPRRGKSPRGGFTLIEIMIAVTLLALVLANLYMVFGDTNKAMRARESTFETEVEARRVLDRIAMRVIGAELDTLEIPSSSPNSSASIDFNVNLGFDEGQVQWSPGQRIAHDGTSQVSWAESPGQEDERRAVWTNHAAQLLQGEEMNGEDDNGNGLIDERGLEFHVQGKMVVISLTIEKVGPGGKLSTKTVSTRVTCRN